jgi:NAD+ kinase
MSDLNVLVIHRMTSYQHMLTGESRATVEALREQHDPLIQRMLLADATHNRSMQKIYDELDSRKIKAIWRHDFSGLIPDSFDLVITVGGDGTVLHASHAIGKVPVLSINSSPETSTGYFSSGDANEFSRILDAVLDNTLKLQQLFRMEVTLNGEVVNNRVLNDVLFCNDCPAMTTRYHLSLNARWEHQISSGVWVSTAAGSTAAVKAAGGVPMDPGMTTLQYVVREPCPGGGRDEMALPTLISGLFGAEDSFAIRSKSLSATLFIDGPHVVVPVKYGDIITFSGGAAPLFLSGKLDENKT